MYAPAHLWEMRSYRRPEALRCSGARTGPVHTAADRADSRRLLAWLGGAGNPRAHARSRFASIGSPAAPLPLRRAAGSDAAALRTIARTALLWRFSSKHATQGVALCSRGRPQPEAENEQRRHRMLRRLGVRAASIPKPAAPCESRSHLSFNQAISRQGLGSTDTFGAPSAALR